MYLRFSGAAHLRAAMRVGGKKLAGIYGHSHLSDVNVGSVNFGRTEHLFEKGFEIIKYASLFTDIQ